MRLCIRGKGVLEDRLQGHEGHRGLRTYGIRVSSGCFVQYHANYPRCKRLVQPWIIGNASGDRLSASNKNCDNTFIPTSQFGSIFPVNFVVQRYHFSGDTWHPDDAEVSISTTRVCRRCSDNVCDAVSL